MGESRACLVRVVVYAYAMPRQQLLLRWLRDAKGKELAVLKKKPAPSAQQLLARDGDDRRAGPSALSLVRMHTRAGCWCISSTRLFHGGAETQLLCENAREARVVYTLAGASQRRADVPDGLAPLAFVGAGLMQGA